ncbi:AI-2E family transporter [Spongiivirga citrea]|uniref:AI-2E family transporter n=1 Tax=Spongiivirga citrea TaxID=1481457 RepID=A0A6M0CKI0_9FLAO|nr:AI-2E family transporter [Spongiivirga citrea]NER15927.1 AI-2E family transporter [Spongiivirga citrea]
MKPKTIANGILRAVGILVGIFILLYFLYQIRSVLGYIAIAAVISLIGRPIVLFLKSKLKFKNTLAVIATMVLMVGLLLGVFFMFIPLVLEQGKNLSLLDIDALRGNLEDLYAQVLSYFDSSNIDIEEQVKEADVFSKFNFQMIPDFLNSVVGAFGSFSIGLFSVLFIAFFLLKDSQLLVDGIMVLTPKGKEKRANKSFEKIKGLLSRYFIGLLLQILILFILYSIVLLIFGIDNAIVIAFLCALMNLIPYVGPIISAVLLMILSMTSNLGEDFSSVILPTTIYVMIGFVVAQLVDNFFSQPFIFSSSVKSHPLEIFLIIIIAGLLFGVIGMIVAVPAYTVIKVILKEFLAENKLVKSLTKDI